MSGDSKQISNPSSTGGGGAHFENRVQTAFAILMLVGGFSPCLPSWPIVKIKLQGRYQDFETDDLIVYCKDPITGKQAKLMGQITKSVKINKSNEKFGDVIKAAWNDFNNPEIFSADSKDAIALLCGPLSAKDTNGVRNLLQQAKYAEDVEDFFTKINLVRATSDYQRDRLDVFRSCLKKANNNIELKDCELWRFLKSFHLLIFDLDIKGITLSLLHTLINQYSQNSAEALWSQIYEHIQWVNENAGLIEISSITDNIISLFNKPSQVVIPNDLVKDTSKIVIDNWNNQPNAVELSIVNISGSWNENSNNDKAIISKLARKEYSELINNLRDILQLPKSPISLKNGIWSIKDRQKLWQTLGSRIFDDNLNLFRECVVKVLTEHDPQFKLAKEERFAAIIYDKVLMYSHQLRKGLAESLALIGCYSKTLTHCSLDKAEETVVLAVREIFNDADWVLWASLGDFLPLLAEASPEEFLKAVENALQHDDCPFDTLFAQEDSGFTGRNYMVGLLWALETLAWEEKYIVCVCVILGQLAKRDPGGNWSNRPINSLYTIFLPWHPQTIATIKKRKVAVQTLEKELPDIAWKLLISLLPNQHQTSMGTRKPEIRNWIPKKWTGKVLKKEYWEQVFYYAEFAVEKAKDNIERLNELISNLDNLPKPAFDKLLSYLSSDTITTKSEEERISLWTNLVNFTAKHKCFSDANWALDSDLIAKVDKVAEALEPKNPINLYARLFNGRDYDLYDDKSDLEEQRKKFNKKRQSALKLILKEGGFDSILVFINKVESPSDIGSALGVIADESIDNKILPLYLENSEEKIKLFVSAYVWNRYYHKDWNWVDNNIAKGWSKSQIARYLIFLPFTNETWKRVNTNLSDSESLYWKQAIVNPYHTEDGLSYAIDKLIEYVRPYSAIDCIYKAIRDKKPLDINLIIRALISAISSQEPRNNMNVYYITEIIKILQKDSTISSEDLGRIEWAYLPILDGHHGATPIYLETRLAKEPAFFCEVIRIVYRSRKVIKLKSSFFKKIFNSLFSSKKIPEKRKGLSKQEKAQVFNAWKLLNKWRIPPGIQPDGNFDCTNFLNWLQEALKTCSKTGHLEVANLHIGKVLIYCPPDPSGFWINKTVANYLNKKDTEKMRKGFRLAIFNSRGAHAVDPMGNPEREFAIKYRQQAEKTENAGFQRLAASLKSLADSYEREAVRIIDEHNLEDE